MHPFSEDSIPVSGSPDPESTGNPAPPMAEAIPLEPTPDPATFYRSRKRQTLLGIAILVVVLGVVAGTLEDEADPGRPVRLLFGVSLSILVASWCHYDALEHGRRLSGPMRVGLLLLWIIVFPIYAFRARGLGGFKLIFLAGLVFGAALMLFSISALVTWGILTILSRAT